MRTVIGAELRLNLLVVRPDDVPIFLDVYGNAARSARWFTCSLESYGLLLRRGLREIVLLTISNGEFDDAPITEFESDSAARNIDQLFSDVREEAGLLSTPSLGWDYLNLYFVISSFKKSKKIGSILASKLPKGLDYRMVLPNVPADYHLDSFCYKSVILSCLSKFNISCFQASGKMLTRRDAVYKANFSFGSVDGFAQTLISVPTLYHPRREDHDLLSALSPGAIEFESPFFDVPYTSRRLALGFSEVSLATRLLPYTDLIKRRVFVSLRRYCSGITGRTLSRILERALFQMRFFQMLTYSSKLKEIKSLLITNHDGGLQGPLLTWANQRKLGVVVLPHSSIDNIPLPRMDTRYQFNGLSIPDNLPLGSQSSSFDVGLKAREEYSKSIRDEFCRYIRSIKNQGIHLLVVHNALDDYAGCPAVSFDDYKSSVSHLSKVAEIYGIRHRFKPRKASNEIFSKLGDFKNKDAAISWANLMIGYGQPSSILFDCVFKNCFPVHITDRPLTRKEFQLLPRGTFIVRKRSLLMGFEYILSLIRSPVR